MRLKFYDSTAEKFIFRDEVKNCEMKGVSEMVAVNHGLAIDE